MGSEPRAGKPHRHGPSSWPKLPEAAEFQQASSMLRALSEPAR